MNVMEALNICLRVEASVINGTFVKEWLQAGKIKEEFIEGFATKEEMEDLPEKLAYAVTGDDDIVKNQSEGVVTETTVKEEPKDEDLDASEGALIIDEDLDISEGALIIDEDDSVNSEAEDVITEGPEHAIAVKREPKNEVMEMSDDEVVAYQDPGVVLKAQKVGLKEEQRAEVQEHREVAVLGLKTEDFTEMKGSIANATIFEWPASVIKEELIIPDDTPNFWQNVEMGFLMNNPSPLLSISAPIESDRLSSPKAQPDTLEHAFCDKCQRVYKTTKSLKIVVCADCKRRLRYRCLAPGCLVEYTVMKTLLRHIRREHGYANQAGTDTLRKFKCTKCKFSSNSKAGFISHMKAEQRFK